MNRALFLLAALPVCGWAQRPEFVRITPGDFRMAKTEVTCEQFRAFASATGYRTAAEKAGSERTWRSPGFATKARQPVVYVTPSDAAAYCEWIGARLPTDEEWEHAARAGATTRHYWGEALDPRYLWYRANSGGRPQAAGRKRPNAWGLHDMEGNVWEWTAAPPDNGQAMANRRGGSWIDCENIETAPGKPPAPLIGLSKYFKIPVKLDHRYDDIGFRCARSQP